MTLGTDNIRKRSAMAEIKGIVAVAVATLSGVGYAKGGGSIAAAIFCVAWYLLNPAMEMQLIILAAVLAVGIWSADVSGRIWNKKDDSRIVIDEVAGMLISLLFIQRQVSLYILGYLLFRFFDIIKPLGIKKAEKLPGGWGVMADDILAGIYALLLLQLTQWIIYHI